MGKFAERINGDDTESETARGEFISPLITAPLPRSDTSGSPRTARRRTAS